MLLHNIFLKHFATLNSKTFQLRYPRSSKLFLLETSLFNNKNYKIDILRLAKTIHFMWSNYCSKFRQHGFAVTLVYRNKKSKISGYRIFTLNWSMWRFCRQFSLLLQQNAREIPSIVLPKQNFACLQSICSRYRWNLFSKGFHSLLSVIFFVFSKWAETEIDLVSFFSD